MSPKTVAIAAIAALTCALLCSSLAQQPTPMKIPNAIEEQPKPHAVTVTGLNGRYQATGLNANNTFILIDTHTGQCWIKSPTQAWQDLGAPVRAKEQSGD